eukprot:CAMPEP_0198121882 /NCGR_PEP_ID=MMETSP1442-20131203/33316_1 /TAXON_ID= /ORGANISM="Craspedostauros australis, Strain CCMP3328" /LENGTH=602 /DNA_ID=CAMNT_0043780767 /DNA_START=142 /DNA_END=1950 /DNA_ORIENTATION=+
MAGRKAGPGGLRAAFGATPQALSIYRISLGMLLTSELVLRFQFLHAFYTDEGTMPLHLLLPRIDTLYRWFCIHCHFGTLFQQQVLLAIQVIFAVMFTLGYRTKLASVVSWYMYSSAILRNTWLYFILDRYFFYLLFYGMFLPLSQCWSVDASMSKSPQLSNSPPSSASMASSKDQGQMAGESKSNDPQPTVSKAGNGEPSGVSVIVSPATVTLKLLVLWIYLDAGGGKYMDPLKGWTFYADPLPALDTYCRHTFMARCLYAILGPMGLRLLTPTVVWVELLSAPLAFVFSYVGNAKMTYAMIGIISSLHFGISLTIRNAVLLSFVAIVSWAIFLPVGWKESTTSSSSSARPQSDDAADDHSRSQMTPSTTTATASTTTTTTTNQLARSLINPSTLIIVAMISANVWFETVGDCTSGLKRNIFATLLQNRWNVFIGAEEYVTWEIAPGRLADGSIVDVWGRRDEVEWTMPGTGAPCTSTARPGRWRSFPYLAELDEEDNHILWEYLCMQWDAENLVDDPKNPHPERRLLRYNFFMLQADVLPNMGFSSTKKRLVHSHECGQTWQDVVNERRHQAGNENEDEKQRQQQEQFGSMLSSGDGGGDL